MYDTLNMKYYTDDADGVSLLEEVTARLNPDTLSEHQYNGGSYVVVAGKLGTLDVSVSRYRVKVSDSSFAKYYFGSPYKVMGRKDMQMCLEKLSDELHLPMSKAEVTRLDFGQNFVMKADTGVYLNHLGALKGTTRKPLGDGLYYSGKNVEIAFYNKNREQTRAGNQIPELYKGKQVLRYEYRYMHRLPELLDVPQMTANLLYSESFYMRLVDMWERNFNAIQKLGDININFELMTTKRELYRAALLNLIEQRGGQLAFTESIVEAAKMGKVTAKQKHDLLAAVEDACKIDATGLVVDNECVKELEAKIKQATRFYR